MVVPDEEPTLYPSKSELEEPNKIRFKDKRASKHQYSIFCLKDLRFHVAQLSSKTIEKDGKDRFVRYKRFSPFKTFLKTTDI